VAVAAVAAAALAQALGETVFAPAVAKERPTSRGRLALTKDAPSAAQP
jgi:hypothetical protein